MHSPVSAVPPRRPAPGRLLPLCLVTIVAACGGGGGGGGGGGPVTPTDDLESGLNKLGVPTERTPRESAPGLEVDDADTPLGRRPVLSRTDELALINLGTTGMPASTSPLLLLELTDGNGNATADVIYGQDQNQVPFLPQSSSFQSPGTLRDAVAADCDGNGLEEIVLVYQDGIETRVRRVGDQTQGFADTDVQIATFGNIENVTAIAADLDLDGRDDLVLGMTEGGRGKVRAFRASGSTFVPLGSEIDIAPDVNGATMWLQLCAGNVDTDGRPEIAVAVQELSGGGAGTARTLVLDDAQAGFAVLRNEVFTARDQNQTLRVALTSSIALGDVDGDGLDEVLFAGLTEFADQCDSTKMLFVALDDAIGQFVELGTFYGTYSYSGCNSPSNRRVRTIHLNALDLDGDGRDEVAANRYVFDDFVDASPWTEVNDWRLPADTIWNQNAHGFFDRTTSAFVKGDFNGDDREDLAVHRQDLNDVRVYGLPATSASVTELRSVPVTFQNSQQRRFPILLPVNVDQDSAVLSYAEAEYQLVFSEPIVLAALAAPPTRQGIGQNVAGSFTAFGNTTSTASESERSVTFSAGVSAGVNIDGGPLTQSEFEFKATLTEAATRTRGQAYELSKTIIFTSAPEEDLVVFTTVPIDRYVFTVLSHPDPALIGEKVTVDYPRTPITLQAERTFYNGSIPAGAQRVDASVFEHVVGDPSTYPGIARRNALRSLYGGLQVGPQSVGQGGGSTEVTLQVGSSISSGGALSLSYEQELTATGGTVLGGVSVGVEATSTWKVQSGTSTTYTGVVGAIDAANFAANGYSFGLFTYVYRAPGSQQFQVLNYWVE
ncbi:MAG: hypothetical protein ACE37K_08115 [Planctomycetota bacterium]